MRRLKLTDVLGLALATVAVVAVSLYARAQQSDAEEGQALEGRIVELGSGGEADLPVVDQTDEEADQPATPKFWIGISGRPLSNAVLRTHLQLAEDLGVVIEDVVPGSPAEKAGLRKHDVLIGVNSKPATDIGVLQDAVLKADAEPIELKVIRLAKEVELTVTPEPTPEDFAEQMTRRQPADPLEGFEGMQGFNSDLLEQLQKAAPQAFRNIGPGIVLNGRQFNFGNVPNGVSVSVTREGDGPAKVTVKRGGETWTVEGDDDEALEKLPEDLRPMVRRLLRMNRGGGPPTLEQFDFGGEFENLVPDDLGNFNFGDLEAQVEEQARRAAERWRGQAGRRGNNADAANQRLLERMEQMEQRIEQLQEQLRGQSDSGGSDN